MRKIPFLPLSCQRIKEKGGKFAYNSTLESHRVKIIRRIFISESSGFGVFAAHFPLKSDRLVIAGQLSGVVEGDRLDVVGEEVAHPRFGRQFRIHSFSHFIPDDLEGLKSFLASGRFKGVGEKTAQKLIDGFGRDLPAILEKEPQRLFDLKGISRKVVTVIEETYRELHDQRELIIKLSPLGVSQDLIMRILAFYEDQAMAVVSRNPYRMMNDLKGVGFKTADLIGRAMGFELDHPLRIQSALLWLVEQAEQRRGDMYVSSNDLIMRGRNLFGCSGINLAEHLRLLVDRKMLNAVEEPEPGYIRPICLWTEKAIAERLRNLWDSGSDRKGDIAPAENIDRDVCRLTEGQLRAVELAFSVPIQIITGGPGTGKTTVIKEIVSRCLAVGLNVALAAPTGRAAKRIEEASGFEASTIHRLLKINPESGEFVHHEKNQMDLDMLILDEFSMVDAFLFAALLKAVKPGTRLVFIGDKDQLPSVGPGNVIRDLISSARLPVSVLSHNFRQEEAASLISLAGHIREGQAELFLQTCGDDPQRLLFIPSDTEEHAQRIVMSEMAKMLTRISVRSMDYQILSPMYRGAVGVEKLNDLIQEKYNPREVVLEITGRRFKLGDRVMQLKNNYQLEVFNGEQGIICGYDTQRRLLKVEFTDRLVELSREHLDEIMLSYVTTVHKAQGTEFQEIILCLLPSHGLMLNRELFYTALTRARHRVVLIGSRLAVTRAIRQAMPRYRKTLLMEHMKKEFL